MLDSQFCINMLKYNVQTCLFLILIMAIERIIYKENPMYAVLDKDMIKNKISPHLSKTKRGHATKLPHGLE